MERVFTSFAIKNMQNYSVNTCFKFLPEKNDHEKKRPMGFFLKAT